MKELYHRVANIIDSYFTPKNEMALEHLKRVIDDVFKAFGNCGTCWGRGYTAYTRESIEYCMCHRGQVLRRIVERDNA